MHHEVTIIPDDTGSTQDRTDVSERVQSAAEGYDEIAYRAEDSTRRIIAAVQGALDGFVEALDKYDIGAEGQRAIEQAGEVARAAGVEGKAQAETPEMQQLGRGIKTAGAATADATRSAYGTVKEGAVGVKESVSESAHHVRENVGERVESAKYAAQRVKEEVKVRADAVGETGRRAKVAPRHIRHELGEAFASWKKAFVTNLAMMALVGLFGLTAFIVLTIALIAGFTLLIGWVAALFLVTVLYAIVAGICFAVAKSAKTKAAHEREERMENAREEVRHVVRPVRDAFSRGRTGI